MNEADTCRTYVLPKLKSAGREDEIIAEQLVLISGSILPIEEGHQAKVNALREWWSSRASAFLAHIETQSALLPSVLDRAFV